MNLLPGRNDAQPRPHASRPQAPPLTSERGLVPPAPPPRGPPRGSWSVALPRCSVSPSLAPLGNCRGLRGKRPLRSPPSGLQTKKEEVMRYKIDWRLGCYSGPVTIARTSGATTAPSWVLFSSWKLAARENDLTLLCQRVSVLPPGNPHLVGEKRPGESEPIMKAHLMGLLYIPQGLVQTSFPRRPFLSPLSTLPLPARIVSPSFQQNR